MRVADLVTRLRALGGALPALASSYPLSAPSFGVPATQEELDALESATGMRLPGDYRAFLGLCNAVEAMDVFNGYRLFEPAFIPRIAGEGENLASVVVNGSTVAAMPIGGNGGGDFFFLVPSHGVWRISHEVLPSGGEPVDVAGGRWGTTYLVSRSGNAVR